jgi:excinuclease ABC subunit A
VGGIPTTSNGHNPNAGPQPLNIAATPDAIKIRGKFVAPKKKTGMPEASPIKPAAKSATKKVTKKATPKKSKKSA